MKNSRWFRILVFFVLAFLISFTLNLLPHLIAEGVDVRGIFCGFGPLVSALICYKVFGTPNIYGLSLGGTRPVLTAGLVAFALLLPVALTHNPRSAFLVLVLTQTVYCFGEEFGWRHYLQNATAGMNKWAASLLTGTLWFFWHYSWIGDPIRVLAGQHIPFAIGAPVCIAFLSLLSLLFRDLVGRTKSILLPTVGHAVMKFGAPLPMLAVLAAFIVVLISLGKADRKQPMHF